MCETPVISLPTETVNLCSRIVSILSGVSALVGLGEIAFAFDLYMWLTSINFMRKVGNYTWKK